VAVEAGRRHPDFAWVAAAHRHHDLVLLSVFLDK
jgi:hypothetical protein